MRQGQLDRLGIIAALLAESGHEGPVQTDPTTGIDRILAQEDPVGRGIRLAEEILVMTVELAGPGQQGLPVKGRMPLQGAEEAVFRQGFRPGLDVPGHEEAHAQLARTDRFAGPHITAPQRGYPGRARRCGAHVPADLRVERPGVWRQEEEDVPGPGHAPTVIGEGEGRRRAAGRQGSMGRHGIGDRHRALNGPVGAPFPRRSARHGIAGGVFRLVDIRNGQHDGPGRVPHVQIAEDRRHGIHIAGHQRQAQHRLPGGYGECIELQGHVEGDKCALCRVMDRPQGHLEDRGTILDRGRSLRLVRRTRHQPQSENGTPHNTFHTDTSAPPNVRTGCVKRRA